MEGLPAVDEPLCIWSGVLEQRVASTLTILVLLRIHAYPSRQTIKQNHHETSRLNRIISSSYSHLNSLRIRLDLLHILILILIVLALLITLILRYNNLITKRRGNLLESLLLRLTSSISVHLNQVPSTSNNA